MDEASIPEAIDQLRLAVRGERLPSPTSLASTAAVEDDDEDDYEDSNDMKHDDNYSLTHILGNSTASDGDGHNHDATLHSRDSFHCTTTETRSATHAESKAPIITPFTKEPRALNVHGGTVGVWHEILHPAPALRRILLIGFMIAFYQQATGVEAMVYYTPKIMESAGIVGNNQVLGATVAIGFVKTCVIFIAALNVEGYGRRKLLLLSASGITVALVLMMTHFMFALSDTTPIVAIMGELCFMASFSMGMGPVCWIFIAELFPLHLRATCVSICTFINRLTSGLVAITFLSIVDLIGEAATFALLTCFSISSLIFVYTFVPETKGKALEEMLAYFESITSREDGAGSDSSIDSDGRGQSDVSGAGRYSDDSNGRKLDTMNLRCQTADSDDIR